MSLEDARIRRLRAEDYQAGVAEGRRLEQEERAAKTLRIYIQFDGPPEPTPRAGRWIGTETEDGRPVDLDCVRVPEGDHGSGYWALVVDAVGARIIEDGD
jgi:hypothetical protein